MTLICILIFSGRINYADNFMIIIAKVLKNNFRELGRKFKCSFPQWMAFGKFCTKFAVKYNFGHKSQQTFI